MCYWNLTNYLTLRSYVLSSILGAEFRNLYQLIITIVQARLFQLSIFLRIIYYPLIKQKSASTSHFSKRSTSVLMACFDYQVTLGKLAAVSAVSIRHVGKRHPA